ncbi:hypothetical protein ACKWTF_013546 [Chironomus riparius]
MYNRSIKIAKYLTKCGMKNSDLIGIMAGNSENLAPIVYACFALGLPINPLAPAMNEKDIVQMFSMTKPKMIFCDAENVKVVQNAVDEMKSDSKILTVMDKVDGYECATEILKSMQSDCVDDFEFPIIDSNSTAAILCSSGSTGSPKGICKSHKHIITSFQQFWPVTYGEPTIFLQNSAIFWISGFSPLIQGVFFRFTRVSAAKLCNAQELVRIFNKYKITAIILPPYMVVSFLQDENLKPFESMRCLMIGGAKVSVQLCEKIKPFVPNGIVLTGYACTEESFIAINSTDKNYGSSGFVFNNNEIRIVDDNGNSLGPNQQGEIYTRIPIQFSGYIGHPEKTAEAFDNDWFKTGDIGYFDDDQYIYIVDRKKELMKFNNYQITPWEIEAIINEIEGITSSCVAGVPEPNSGNDIIHAFVILEESSSITEDFILKYVNDKVIDPKRIRGGVHVVNSFPLGATGKVDRRKVQEMAAKLN